MLKKSLKSYVNIYDKFSDTRNYFWKDLSFLLEYITDNDNLIDIGCGNGRLLTGIGDKNIKYVGVDNCVPLLDIAKERHTREFVVADALNLPFDNDCFDKAFSIAVIHHIPSKEYREQFVKEIYRVLKKDGICCISFWKNVEKKYIPFFWKMFLDKGDYFVPFKNEKGRVLGVRYVHIFDLDEFSKLAEDIGFTIIEKGITNSNGKERNMYFVLRK